MICSKPSSDVACRRLKRAKQAPSDAFSFSAREFGIGVRLLSHRILYLSSRQSAFLLSFSFITSPLMAWTSEVIAGSRAAAGGAAGVAFEAGAVADQREVAAFSATVALVALHAGGADAFEAEIRL